MAPKTKKTVVAAAPDTELVTEPVKITKKTKKPVADDHIVSDSDGEAPPAPEPKKTTKKTEKAEKPVKAEKAEKAEKTEKPKRKPSEYNIMVGEFMKKISLEENEKPKEDRIAPRERMAKAQLMYREWKENKSAVTTH